MKKTVLLCILTLVIGVTVGMLLNFGLLSGSGLLDSGTSPSEIGPASKLLSASPPPAKADLSGNTALLAQGSLVLEALKNGDYAALSRLAHPERGVTFTPYSTVDVKSDMHLTTAQIAEAMTDETQYIWGVIQGRGDPIALTIPDYFKTYVFNTDYTKVPFISVDRTLSAGNALENVTEAYPGDRFLEFYFPGINPNNNGFDWCALKLVFAPLNDTYLLVGIIHSEWTI